MTALQTTRESVVCLPEDTVDPEGELITSIAHSTLPAVQTTLLAEVVSKVTEVAASPNYGSSISGAVANATYIPPGLEVLHFPDHLNTYDGFAVSGQVWGSDITGKLVQVSIAGVTRTARIIDGLWSVIFEDDALPRYQHGNREIVAAINDSHGSKARTSIKVTLEEFTEGYVQIDDTYSILETAQGDVLCASGELALGTHDLQRELIVLLVDSDNTVAMTGIVLPGWQFGEWRARLPLTGLRPGDYYVRAQLMDCAKAALTRVAAGTQAITL